VDVIGDQGSVQEERKPFAADDKQNVEKLK
jgi:hypothetical protein